MSRPEHQAPPELYYGEREASKYACNSRIVQVQREMAERAFELLELPSLSQTSDCSSKDSDGQYDSNEDLRDVSSEGEESRIASTAGFLPKIVLDLGCGSGLSSTVIENAGHVCIGADVSPAMLALNDTESLLLDMGDGVPLRPGSVDAVLSISALQWLFHSHRTCDNPRRRLLALFTTCFAAMGRGARAVFQFYPEADEQVQLVLDCARRAGFAGGLVVDHPQSVKVKKYYLCLSAGGKFALPSPRGADAGDENEVRVERSARQFDGGNRKRQREESRRDWIVRKKDSTRRRLGDEHSVRPDSRYTGRRRKPRF